MPIDCVVPIAGWPGQDTSESSYPLHSSWGRPHLFRMISGPVLSKVLEYVDHQRGRQLAVRVQAGQVVVFGYGVDLHVWPKALIVLERTAPASWGSESFWFVSRFSTWWDWSRLVYSRTCPKEDFILILEQARRRLLWLIFDVLEINPDNLETESQRELMVPDLTIDPSMPGLYKMMAENGVSKRLSAVLEEHRDKYHLLSLAQDALQTRQRHRGPGAEFERLTGSVPDERHLMMLMNQLHHRRVEAFDLTGRLLNSFYDAKPGKMDNETIAAPYRIDKLKGIHADITIHTQPVDGEIVWTAWSGGLPRPGDEPCPPLAASTKGPVQLMRQAGLDLHSRQEWEDWLDHNLDPGELYFEPKAFDMLDEQPLLWSEKRFLPWAASVGMMGIR